MIPEMGSLMEKMLPSAGNPERKLCGKIVLKLSEKKAYDRPPQGRWSRWPTASNFYTR
jgi:hypothetical protein